MNTDFLIIGSGISGLNFALQAAKKGQVTLITKKKLIDSNTNFAQGGIAAVLDKTDNIERHMEDSLKAGAYHNNKKALKFMIKNSKSAIKKLIELGVKFEEKNGELQLTKEGGHSTKRIAYIGDFTGHEIEKILIKEVLSNPQIRIFEDCFALKLIKSNTSCDGAIIIHKNTIKSIFASNTTLATGGIGQVYKHTTNPHIATADGIAMGIEIGAKLKDMEFIQFHPTALAKNTKPKFLISETVRGEGAKLVNSKGEYFMQKLHPLKDLAPRDIIAKEIFEQLKFGPVYLDIRHKSKKFLTQRFPKIYKRLKDFKISMEKDLIPVTPAAHYLCGGIQTNLNGQTCIPHLFCFGESSGTEVHGANRLASNSLLEALVFSNQIAKSLKKRNISRTSISLPKHINLSPTQSKKIKYLKSKIQNIMWKYAGISRNLDKIQKKGLPSIEKIIEELEKFKGANQTLQESKNLALCAKTIMKAALKRKESLGCHQVVEAFSSNFS
ncbi:L-aspartate oxidase [Candidatus Peregrinibacteria bacterium]|nr:L-aspartate oxidase [Candidatus Peregrinibacteria bacterium]